VVWYYGKGEKLSYSILRRRRRGEEEKEQRSGFLCTRC
jgi:hypothetical protein